MHISVRIKLLPTASQKASLLRTMEVFNVAANFAAKEGFAHRAYSRADLHRLTYYPIRQLTGMTSELVIRAIHRAVDCFTRDKTVCPEFRKRSAIVYDNRVLRFKGADTISIASMDGRLTIAVVMADYQKATLAKAFKTGQSDLIYINGTFYLSLSAELEDPSKTPPVDVIGVDFGIKNIAVDSDGIHYSGADIEAYRVTMLTLRGALKSCGTRSAKRHLRKIKRRESNYRRTKNHQISKRIVELAKERSCAIAIEDLTGYKERTRFRKEHRAMAHGWAFYQLRRMIEYKSIRSGVELIVVDRVNTSRTCSRCGHCEKGNRKSQAEFECRACGYTCHADFNGAVNIRNKGRVIWPIVTNVDPRSCDVRGELCCKHSAVS